ncbi:PepSY-associated TM helix domain-containing protein [Rhodococcus koreensis]|uniref:PepSY-associated TM helix domain-containing protein n=1 Tax=Rhodococcus koreensis TaxID=99653 RepID=UPI003671E516
MSIPELERDTPVAQTDKHTVVKDPSPPYSFRPLIMRLHFYAGILVAPFLVLAAVSGGLYALAPSIEQFVYRDYLHVDSTGPAVPVTEQVHAAQQVRPDLTVAAVRPAASPGETTRVLFTDLTLGDSERLAVFVDPATAHSMGELVVYGSSGALPLRTWISQLHRHLHLGDPGLVYSELAASWLWVIALGGVYLWWQRYRTMRARGADNARLFTLDRSSRGRNRTLSWHGVLGVWIAVGLVFLSVTGLTWSKYAGENISELRTALSWTTPKLDKKLDSAPMGSESSGGHDGHGGGQTPAAADPGLLDRTVGELDTVLDIARGNGVTGAVEATIPADTATAFTVTQTRQPWQFATDSIAVNGATGVVTDVSRFADWPLAAKLTSWGIALHMGLLFGLVNQLVLAALAVALLAVIVRGYILWWRRRPTRGTRRIGRPPVRGAWRRIHPATAGGVLAAAVLVGWFVPLLGLSLLAFLLVDLAVGALGRVRARRERPAALEPT